MNEKTWRAYQVIVNKDEEVGEIEHFLSVIHDHLDLKERCKTSETPKVTWARACVEIDKEGVLWILSEDAVR